MSSDWNDFNRRLIEDLRTHGGRATSGPFKGRNVLILTTVGAKSGQTREHPLAYTRDGDHYVIVASKGGAPTNPAWFHNLVAHPDTMIEVLGERIRVHAHVVSGDEYERLYKSHADQLPTFWEYRRKTSRQIPVIVLEPIEKTEKIERPSS
jgi:deazaflavin-dependent oxidoreductase (nitroreductase family)